MTRTEKRLSKYEIVRDKVFKYIVEEVFKTHLVPVTELPLYEILLFDNVSAAKKHIVGIPRAALHTALNNPHHYLQVSSYLVNVACKLTRLLLSEIMYFLDLCVEIQLILAPYVVKFKKFCYKI